MQIVSAKYLGQSSEMDGYISIQVDCRDESGDTDTMTIELECDGRNMEVDNQDLYDEVDVFESEIFMKAYNEGQKDYFGEEN